MSCRLLADRGHSIGLIVLPLELRVGGPTCWFCSTDEAAAQQWLANIGWRLDFFAIDAPSLGTAQVSEYYAV